MNLGRQLFGVLLMVVVPGNRPMGCVAPDTLAGSLSAIAARDWDDIDEANLRSICPTEIGGIECNAGACQTMARQDRVINNKCQCCELFRFNIERNDKGEVTHEHLHNIVIYYSTSSRHELLADAKSLARAMGAPDSDTASISYKEPQDFNWNPDKGKQREIALLNIRLYFQDGAWTAYLHLSRQSL